MDRYFFHVDYGEFRRDEDGTTLPNLVAARAAAVELVGGILRDERDAFWVKRDLTVTVTDAADLTLWTISVSGTQAPSVSTGRFRPR